MRVPFLLDSSNPTNHDGAHIQRDECQKENVQLTAA
jgi:hypothetical protein